MLWPSHHPCQSRSDPYTCPFFLLSTHQLQELTVHLLPNISHYFNKIISVIHFTCQWFYSTISIVLYIIIIAWCICWGSVEKKKQSGDYLIFSSVFRCLVIIFHLYTILRKNTFTALPALPVIIWKHSLTILVLLSDWLQSVLYWIP